MIRSAATKSNDVVDFHAGINLSAGGALSLGADEPHVTSGNFADVALDRTTIDRASTRDRFSPLWIFTSPLKIKLDVSSFIFLAPNLRSSLGRRSINWIAILPFMTLFLNVWKSLSFLCFSLLNLFTVILAPLYVVRAIFLRVALTPLFLIGAVFLRIIGSPLSGALARSGKIGFIVSQFGIVSEFGFNRIALPASPVDRAAHSNVPMLARYAREIRCKTTRLSFAVTDFIHRYAPTDHEKNFTVA